MTLASTSGIGSASFRSMRASRPAGGLIALFGRSGAGKTSIVNVIAGLIRPDEGRVVVDGAALVDTGARRVRAARTGAASATCSRRGACSRT